MKLGEFLAKNRRRRGLSQAEFAKSIGVKSGQHVSNWERGYGALISLKQLRKIVQIHGLNEKEVFLVYMEEAKKRLIERISKAWDSQIKQKTVE